MATITKRNDTYRFVVSHGYDKDGHQVRISKSYKPTSTTPKAIEKEVQKASLDFEEYVKSGRYDEDKRREAEQQEILTFGRYYLNDWQKRRPLLKCDDKTFLEYKKLIDRWAIPTLKDIPLESIKGKHISNIVAEMMQSGLASTTVRRCLCAINSIFRMAYADEVIESNPVDRVRKQLPAIDTKVEHTVFTEEESRNFLEFLNDKDNKEPLQIICFLTLALKTGARRGELIALKWSDIDFDNCEISITKSASAYAGKQITKCPKTKTSNRVIGVNESVIAQLREWKIKQAEYMLSVGSYWQGARGKDASVFTQSNGKQMSLDCPYQAFEKLITKYNETRDDKLPRLRLHDLRHTNATLGIKNGVSILAESKNLGHSNPATTMRIYAHTTREQAREVADAMERIYG